MSIPARTRLRAAGRGGSYDGLTKLGGPWHALVRSLLAGKELWIGDIFHNAARKHPSTQVELDRPLQCIADGRLAYTVVELATIVDDLAARLWAAGLRPGRYVVVYKADNFDIALLAAAASRIGAVPALLSPALDGPVAVALLQRLGGPALVTDGDTMDAKLAGTGLADSAGPILLTAGEAVPGTVALAALAGSPPVTAVRPGRREPMLVTHSSGTTGLPKLAMHCSEGFWHRQAPQKVVSWPIRGREKAAFSITLVHARTYMALEMLLSRGNSMIVAVDPDPASIGPLLVRTRPGFLETHPNTFVEWEALVDAPGEPLSSVRYFNAAFDAIHPRTISVMLNASKRRSPLFFRFYGQSEIGPVSGYCYTRRSAARATGQCVGFPLFGFVSLRIVGSDGKRLPAGGHGHIEARGRSQILTYLGEERRFAEMIHDGWWRMGDMGYRDRLGRLYLLDREVDQVGTIASTLEVEDILMSRLDELREVVIVSGPGDRPVPVVVTAGEQPLDPARWARATSDLPQLAPVVQLAYERLPFTATRKVRRGELAQLIRAQADGERRPAEQGS